MLKRFLKRALKAWGLEIRRLHPKRRDVIQPITSERNADEYDRVWSDRNTLTAYLSKGREELYHEVIAFTLRNGIVAETASIADVGCGPGHFAKLLAAEYRPRRLVGFDFSREVLRVAGSICADAAFIQHDVYSALPEKFDVLFCTEVLEHLSHPQRALDNLVAASHVTILSVPNGRYDTYGGHINYWSLESWRVFLERYNDSHDVRTGYVCSERNLVALIRRKQGSDMTVST